jgi:hypothetical protein
MNKKAQVTIFIILAIVVVAGIVLYFVVGGFSGDVVPGDMQPVYDYYISCVESSVEEGIALMGGQGGYIEVPEFEPGSPYIPFSSQLSFFGQPVPYWMYVSGNNLLKEQVPTKAMMQQQLGKYVEDRLTACDFEDFEAMGYDVYIEPGVVSTIINENSVEVGISNPVTIFKGEQSVSVNSHEFSVGSKLGKFYDMALDVYNSEKEDMFLENYAIDVMRLYAPVDGVDISCAPKVFVDEDIRRGLYDGLELNMNSIKLEGGYYDLSSPDRNYFVKDVGFDVDENVNIMYNRNWPTKIDIYGDRVVEPVGVQPGLAILGFCYVPYHLVYDISFPVMIQFYDSRELFQFPISVIIDNSQPREALPSTFGDVSLEGEVCRYKNSNVLVNTYDSELNPIEARIRFKCLDSICEVGETEIDGGSAVFEGDVPQCVNGFFIASAEGYADGKVQVSTNSENIANIVLKKKYELGLDLGDIGGGMAMLNFVSDDYSTTAIYPDSNSVVLVEGNYNVTVYVYQNSTLTLPGSSDRICVDVPVGGVGGLLGMEEEKCYDVNVPSMSVDMAVIGGGKSYDYVAESMLSGSTELNVNVPLFGKPSSLESLQENYALVEDSRVYLEFE